MKTRATLSLALVAAAWIVTAWHPSPQWVESEYVNGFYLTVHNSIAPFTAAIPFSLGDVLLVATVLFVIALWARQLRAAGKQTRLVAVAILALQTCAVGSLGVIWWRVLWGINYDRAPITSRLVYDANTDSSALRRLEQRAIAQLNSLAPAAHARSATFDMPELERSFQAVTARLGNTRPTVVSMPKESMLDPLLTATGVFGAIDPFTLELIGNSGELWFERPVDYAHEWSHAAGFASEAEANYIATVACIRSRDPVLDYSGWLYVYLFLPHSGVKPQTFVPLVWSDFAALRERNARRINLTAARLQSRLYDRYLKANGVRSGAESYSAFIQLLLGTHLDRSGLPLARSK